MKSIDKYISEDLFQRMEANIQTLFQNLIEGGQIKSGQKQQQSEVNEKAVKVMIAKEFQDAMEQKIIPKVEEVLKNMILQIKLQLTSLNNSLGESLTKE